MKSITDPRHSARKIALTTLFCWIFNEPELDECILMSKELLEEESIDEELSKKIIEAVQKNVTEIDHIIEESAPEWPTDKISKVDLIILRISIAEMLFGVLTPTKVAIDEAIELAKDFGNETSSKFVNGVLGSVVEKHLPHDAKELKKDIAETKISLDETDINKEEHTKEEPEKEQVQTLTEN